MRGLPLPFLASRPTDHIHPPRVARESRGSSSEMTELHLAVMDAEVEKVDTLVRLAELRNPLIPFSVFFPDVNAKDEYGKTALHWAIIGCRMHDNSGLIILRRLLDSGLVKDDLEDKTGTTPLHDAAMEGYDEAVRMLLQKHAIENKTPMDTYMHMQDSDGDTALHCAVHSGEKDVVETLLSMGANPSSQNDSMRTPLSLAVLKQCKDIVEVLLSKGANPNLKDIKGQTPLCYAASKGHKDIVEVLLSNGADPDLEDGDGQTALSLATDGGFTDIVVLLSEKANSRVIGY